MMIKRIALALAILAVMSMGTTAVSAADRTIGPAGTPVIAAPVAEQATITPVQWRGYGYRYRPWGWGYRYQPYGYYSYYAPRFSYPGYYYSAPYAYPYYGYYGTPGFYYSGPNVAFSIPF